MRKLAFLFFLISIRVAAQTTSVSGTVKDLNGVPYANATLKAQLVFTGGIPVSGQPTVTVSNSAQCAAGGWGSSPCQVPFQGTASGSLTSAGTFSGLTLQDNALVTPAATQWLFTMNETGTAPPVGTGPQTCAAQLTITGASQSVSASFAACPALSNVAGGLPTGLSYAAPTLTISTAGSGSGCVALSGNTSGTSTICAPAVAGTSTNPIAISNTLDVANGTASSPAYSFNGGTNSGMFFQGGLGICISGGTVSIGCWNAGTYFLASAASHYAQTAANTDQAGVLTCAASTVTKTFALAYTSTPVIIVSDETTTGGARVSAKSNTAFTVTCSGATDVLDYWTIGNPN